MSSNMKKYIGLDVHQESIAIAVLNSAGKLVMESIVETKAATLLEFLHGLRGELHVTLEEGTWAAWLYDVFKPHVSEIVVCNPRRNALLKEGSKSDKVDARKLAELLRALLNCAQEPGEVLGSLNRILTGQQRGKLISASYLWLDLKTGKGLYSAAGHPPLLRWRNGELERIESNGILIGVLPDVEYPVCEIQFAAGDRFLLYTDGVIEPENAAGDPFGDRRLEEIIRRNQTYSPSHLSGEVLSEVRRWQPAWMTQQDDITLIIIDVTSLAESGTPRATLQVELEGSVT